MTLRLPRLSWTLALVVLALAAARLAVVAWPLASAAGDLRSLVEDATLGWFGHSYVAAQHEPSERQAEYWISAADRALAARPTSEVALGAAWVLDSPVAIDNRFYNSVDDAQSQRDFEKLTLTKCLAAAELATQLAPDDPRTWRARAVLQFSVAYTYAIVLRDESVLAVLEEAARHDANNALYDHLALLALLRERTLARSDGQPYELDASPEWQAQVNRYLDRAASKPYVRGIEDASEELSAFFEQTGVAPRDYKRLINRQGEKLFIRLEVMTHDYLPPEIRGTTPQQRLHELVRLAKVVNQLYESPDENWSARGLLFEQQLVDEHLRARELMAVLAVDDRSELYELLTRAARSHLVAHAAAAKANVPGAWTRPQWTTVPVAQAVENLARGFAATRALPLAVLMAVLAVLTWLTSRALARDCEPQRWRRPAVRHTVAWLTALVISFVMFGMAPAQLIPPQVQVLTLGLGLALIPAIGLLVMVLYYRKHRRSPRVALALLVLLPLYGALLPKMREYFLVRSNAIETFQVRHKGIHVLDASFAEPLIYPWLSDLLSRMNRLQVLGVAVLQWMTYPGITVAALLALSIVGVWYLGWSKRKTPQGWRAALGGALGEVSRSARGAAVAALLVFLLVVPTFLRESNAELALLKSAPRRSYNPHPLGPTIAAERARILADAELMAEYQRQAEEQVERLKLRDENGGNLLPSLK